MVRAARRRVRPSALRSAGLLDVVRAVDGPGPTFVCTEIRQRGPLSTPAAACTSPCPIARAMWAAEDAWRQALAGVTIADLARDVDVDSGPEALVSVSAWLGGDKDG
ncbi:Rrf2 family transcriptional regulator [Micromonospora sp. ALFpr18c]|uniref:Rrf2 family transcriptional regulator n=1 Tax=unclassified Micromonospora TaxID=2617518 RepID=UPI001788CC29|nr:Rrf2 family transcriptional regulator [Micromonospora sp. ALFpr18c]